MAQFERPNPNNYTLGGVRLWANELLDPTTSPPTYAGFVDLGCIEEAPIAQAIEFQEHFCTGTGTRVKDKKIVKEVSSTITVTLVEPDVENLRLFFLGGDITDVAAAPAGGSVVDEVVKLVGTERRILGKGLNASAIVVTDLTSTTTYVLGTDYDVEDHFSYKAIRRISGGGISDGEIVLVDYNYDILASRNFNPLTKILKEGKVIFMGVSDTGNEMLAEFDKVQINPSGDFNWNNDDWTTFQLELDILDNSVNVPAAPFGTIKHLGTGQNL